VTPHAATAIPVAATQGSDLATAAHTLGQIAVVALIVTIVAAGYLFTCLVWPFGTCRRCQGYGLRKAPLGSALRHCGRCHGTGYRVRIGRHVINHLRATRNAGTK
jgi:hypothetical protein